MKHLKQFHFQIKTLKKVETKEEKKQNPEKVDDEVKQVSEFEKKDLFDPNNIAALIDKSKEESAEVLKTNDDITQDQERNVENTGLTLSEEDALKGTNIWVLEYSIRITI